MIRSDWFARDTVPGRALLTLRWAGAVAYFVVLGFDWYEHGIPFDREGLLLWIAIGLGVASIGRHPVWLLWVALDFLPFALVLIAYDYLRGLSDTLGMPTWWHPQVDVDKFLFFGYEPTVWLQEQLKHSDVRWYDILVTLCYCSFFFLPYVTAGVLWLRSRTDFYRWSLRFVSLSFLGFALFTLIPAAPPWAAARCSATDIAGHPNDPACMYFDDHSGGILGAMSSSQPGAVPWIERISTRGLSDLHLSVARSLLDNGQATADPVAAVPSLHLGGTVLFVIFMWPRVSRWWRPVLVAYPLAMTFSLVYSAEHFVADCIAGALVAVLVCYVASLIERRRKQARAADTLDRQAQTDHSQEPACPPTTKSPTAETPSST